MEQLIVIEPSDSGEFIINDKTDISSFKYLLKIEGDEIKINPSLKYEDENLDGLESLATLFAILGLPK